MPDDGGVTLADIQRQLNGVATQVAGLGGHMQANATTLENIQQDISALRSSQDDDRQRLTRAEGAIQELQVQHKQGERSRGTWWDRVLTLLVALSGWIAAIWHPWTGGAH